MTVLLLLASGNAKVSTAQAVNEKQTVAVRVRGFVVDATTDEPIEKFVTQAGKFDPKTPQKVTWGFSEGRSSSKRKGYFSTTIRWSQGWTARILADGYLPHPVIEEAPAEGEDVIEVTIKLTPGRLIGGQVVNDQGRPVAGASVFAVGQRGISLAGGNAYLFTGRIDSKALKVLTDQDGWFELPVGEARALAVSSKEIDAWPVPLKKDQKVVEIRIPRPASVTIACDIAGADTNDQVFYQLLGHHMDGFQGIEVSQTLPIRNGRLELKGLTPGKYQFCRYRMLRYADMGRSAMLDRSFIELKPGEVRQINYVRKQGSRVRGKVTWPRTTELAGVLLQVNSLTPTKQPWSNSTYTRQLDGRVIAGAPQQSKIENQAAEFVTERLSPGEYEIEIQGFAPLTDAQRVRTGFIGPTLVAKAKLIVPDQGEVAPLQIRLK